LLIQAFVDDVADVVEIQGDFEVHCQLEEQAWAAHWIVVEELEHMRLLVHKRDSAEILMRN
jgi:hypothetical protein